MSSLKVEVTMGPNPAPTTPASSGPTSSSTSTSSSSSSSDSGASAANNLPPLLDPGNPVYPRTFNTLSERLTALEQITSFSSVPRPLGLTPSIALEQANTNRPLAPTVQALLQRWDHVTKGSFQKLNQQLSQLRSSLDGHASVTEWVRSAAAKEALVLLAEDDLLQTAAALQAIEPSLALLDAPLPFDLATVDRQLSELEVATTRQAAQATALHAAVEQCADEYTQEVARLNRRLVHWSRTLDQWEAAVDTIAAARARPKLEE